MSQEETTPGPMMAVPYSVWQQLMREASAQTFVEANRQASPIFAGLVWTWRDLATLLRAHAPGPLTDHEVSGMITALRTEETQSLLEPLAQPLTEALSNLCEERMRPKAPVRLAFAPGGRVERDAAGNITKFDMREVSLVLAPAPNGSAGKGEEVEA